jgi:hypothetical protein
MEPQVFLPLCGVGLVPKRGCLLTLTYYAFHRWYEFGVRRRNDIDRGKPKNSEKKTCPSATLSTTKSTWIDPGANPGLRGERPATDRPIQFEINWLLVCFRFVDKTFVWSTGLSREKAGGTSDVWITEIQIGSVEAVLSHLSSWECYLKRPESGRKEKKPYLERAVLCDGRLIFHT